MMNLQLVYINASGMRFLNKARCLTWRFPQYTIFSDVKNVLNSSCKSSFVRIIYTDCKLQRMLNCALQTQNSKDIIENLIEETYCKENLQLLNNQCVKLIRLSNGCHYLDELLSNQEIKDIFSRPFFYKVDLENNPGQFFVSSQPLYFIDHALNCSSNANKLQIDENVYTYSNEKSKIPENAINKPSEEQLLNVINRLTFSLIHFFEKPLDFTIYSKDIVFQNNIQGVITKGLMTYMQNMYLMKIYGRFHYAHVKVEILKVTHHIEDGTIRVRWRVNGITRQKVLMQFFKLKPVNMQHLAENNSEWLDGFSVFNVGEDGLIYKHVCDKMIPDDEVSKVKQPDLKTRLLRLFGLQQRTPLAGGLHCENMLVCQKQNPEIFPHRKLT